MTAKPATRVTANGPPARRAQGARKPDQDEISKRAHIIHLHEDQSDQLENWLRAERELIRSRGWHRPGEPKRRSALARGACDPPLRALPAARFAGESADQM
jgi:hypothetical protein